MWSGEPLGSSVERGLSEKDFTAGESRAESWKEWGQSGCHHRTPWTGWLQQQMVACLFVEFFCYINKPIGFRLWRFPWSVGPQSPGGRLYCEGGSGAGPSLSVLPPERGSYSCSWACWVGSLWAPLLPRPHLERSHLQGEGGTVLLPGTPNSPLPPHSRALPSGERGGGDLGESPHFALTRHCLDLLP